MLICALRDHPQFTAYLALAAVCFVWGTTYLGIRIALESVSPAVLIASRFTLSGLILLVVAAATGTKMPPRREWIRTAANGIVILGIGNGCLAYAEQWIPSGLAALFITTSPFWMVGIEAAIPGGERLHAPTIAGMLIGLSGVALLVAPSATGGLHGPILIGFLILQLGGAGWSLGSIAQRRTKATAHPVVSGAIQQLATGLVYVVPAILLKGHAIHWSTRGILAIVYLMVFGSIVGYSAYIFALKELPVAIVSIYNYVNPIVAVFLGWLVYREPFGWREAMAMTVIFAGIAIVKTYGRKPVIATAR